MQRSDTTTGRMSQLEEDTDSMEMEREERTVTQGLDDCRK